MPFLRLYVFQPMHTPDRLLNAYLACRTARPSPPGLIITLIIALLHALTHRLRRIKQRQSYLKPK